MACKITPSHLPFLISDHRAAFNVGEMFASNLISSHIAAGFPAVETGHVEQHAQLSVLLDELFKLRHEMFVICLGQNFR